MNSEIELEKNIALTCKLSNRDQVKRMNELHQTIFKKIDQAIERVDSYELIFQKPDDHLNDELAEFIKFERICCPG